MTDMTQFAVARVVPTVPLTPEQQARLDKRIAREQERRKTLARLREINAAAEASQRTKPRKPTETRTPLPGDPRSRPQPLQIRPCTGPCGRPTRANSTPLNRAPGTIPRIRDGKCRTCLRVTADGAT